VRFDFQSLHSRSAGDIKPAQLIMIRNWIEPGIGQKLAHLLNKWQVADAEALHDGQIVSIIRLFVGGMLSLPK